MEIKNTDITKSRHPIAKNYLNFVEIAFDVITNTIPIISTTKSKIITIYPGLLHFIKNINVSAVLIPYTMQPTANTIAEILPYTPYIINTTIPVIPTEKL